MPRALLHSSAAGAEPSAWAIGIVLPGSCQLFTGGGNVGFRGGLLSCIEGRSVQHAEVSRGFEVLIESAGIECLSVELLGELQGGIQRNKSGMEFDGTGRLEGGIGFFLELLEFREIGAQREGGGAPCENDG